MDKPDKGYKTGIAAPKVVTILCAASGWAAAVASVISYPYIFGAAAIILGIESAKAGAGWGCRSLQPASLLMAAGLMMNGMLYDYLRNAVGILCIY